MATQTAHSETPGGAHGAFPPFQRETFASQLIWFAIFFILLYLLMSRLALPRVGGILEARRSRIAADLAEAQKLKEESETALAGYEKALAEARARAQAIGNETRERFAAEAEAQRKALEGQLHARLVEAEKSVAATKTAAMANVRGIAVEAATAIVERLIGARPSPQVTEGAVDKTLTGDRANRNPDR
jgi:F-type H+-transporting ATPase subunit b